MAERRGQVAVKDLPPKLQKKLRRQKIMPKKARKLNRSMAGNALLFTLMFICGVFMALPLVMIINNALKPRTNCTSSRRRFLCATRICATSRICLS